MRQEFGLIGKRLDEMRRIRALTTEDLAKAVEKHRSYLSNLMKPGVHKANGDLIYRLSVALECRSDYLLGLSEEYVVWTYADVMNKYLAQVPDEEKEILVINFVKSCQTYTLRSDMQNAKPASYKPSTIENNIYQYL